MYIFNSPSLPTVMEMTTEYKTNMPVPMLEVRKKATHRPDTWELLLYGRLYGRPTDDFPHDELPGRRAQETLKEPH